MPTLPQISDQASAAAAREAFERSGWRLLGTGDWSWVFADPSDTLAARITPFDPAYRMFVDFCRQGPANRFLPRLERVLPLVRDGYVVVMERLYPADEEAAERFCRTLDGAGSEPDAEIAELRERLRVLLSEGARRFALWGGSDIRPGNILADAKGQLKLIDPIYVRGKTIVEMIAAGNGQMLRDFSQSQLEDFLTIPVFKPGAETEALRKRVAEIFATNLRR